MDKRAFFIFLIGIIQNVSAQQIRVQDSLGTPIPFATAELLDGKRSYFTDQKGVLDLDVIHPSFHDSILFTSIGYDGIIIAVRDLNTTVILQKQIPVLSEVILVPGKWKTTSYGSRKIKADSYGAFRTISAPGEQLGRLIYPEKKARIQLIESVQFFYSNAAGTNMPVRLRLYEPDANGLPGKDLLTSSFIREQTGNTGWLTFDLSEHPVRMTDKGVIAAVEYFRTDTSYYHTVKMMSSSNADSMFVLKDVKVWGGMFKTDLDGDAPVSLYRQMGKWEPIRLEPFQKIFTNLYVKIRARYLPEN